MTGNVHYMRISGKHFCACGDVAHPAADAHTMHMAKDGKPKHFLRAWRKHKGKTLEWVAEHIHMSHQNLGKIERGQVPVNDELLAILADLYGTDQGSLIVRDPAKLTGEDAIYSIWDTLTPPQKKEALEIIEVIKRRA